MATKRKTISKTVRFEVFKRDSFTCQYCGRHAPDIALHVDHIQPVSKGGDNSILNFITACSECNAGKSNVLLSDSTAIAKQKAQLDDLQARREQIEMMLEWRNGLKSIDEDVTSIAADAFDALTPENWSLTESGRSDLLKLTKKFGLDAVLTAIETTGRQYIKPELTNEKEIQANIDNAFRKVGGICRVSQQPDHMKDLYYIRGIIRNKCTNYFNPWQAINLLENAYNDGVPMAELRGMAFEVRNWSNFQTLIMELMELWQDSE